MTEIAVREYHEDDAPSVGRLIADTYGEYNLDFLPVKARGPFLGPFQHAHTAVVDQVYAGIKSFVGKAAKSGDFGLPVGGVVAQEVVDDPGKLLLSNHARAWIRPNELQAHSRKLSGLCRIRLTRS